MTLILVIGCSGCWEEIRYESSDVVPREIESTLPESSALAAWRMASKWSFAVALCAKGLDVDRYGEYLKQAGHAANSLQIELPDLPQHIPAEEREKTLIDFLLEEASPDLSRQLLTRYDAQHAALAELAVKTHLLLLIYTPNSPQVEPLLSAVRRAAKDSSLPQGVWQDLVTRLSERAEFEHVKAAIYALHRQALDGLGGESHP